MPSSEIRFFLARVADQAERYPDVVKFMNTVIDMEGFLSKDAQNLLSVAYKAMTGARRTALRIINGFLDDDGVILIPERVAVLTELRSQLMAELDVYCTELITLIDSKLLPSATDIRSQVFYEKLKGDYCRYSIEYKPEADRVEVAQRANACYLKALTIAGDGFMKNHSAYLGVALNYSVFLYEIMGKKQEGIDFADRSYKEACDNFHVEDESDYSEAKTIVGLLRDNVALWREELSA
jgi:14-3-3 protein epsilon